MERLIKLALFVYFFRFYWRLIGFKREDLYGEVDEDHTYI